MLEQLESLRNQTPEEAAVDLIQDVELDTLSR